MIGNKRLAMLAYVHPLKMLFNEYLKKNLKSNSNYISTELITYILIEEFFNSYLNTGELDLMDIDSGLSLSFEYLQHNETEDLDEDSALVNVYVEVMGMISDLTLIFINYVQTHLKHIESFVLTDAIRENNFGNNSTYWDIYQKTDSTIELKFNNHEN